MSEISSTVKALLSHTNGTIPVILFGAHDTGGFDKESGFRIVGRAPDQTAVPYMIEVCSFFTFFFDAFFDTFHCFLFIFPSLPLFFSYSPLNKRAKKTKAFKMIIKLTRAARQRRRHPRGTIFWIPGWSWRRWEVSDERCRLVWGVRSRV